MEIYTLISSITSQIWAISQVLTEYNSYSMEKRVIFNEAISSMRKALNKTRIFLRNPDFSDTNQLSELSDLWNNASEKVGIIDISLGQVLGNKSRFWSDHELFVKLGRDQEIMSLEEVVSEIDNLYTKLRS